MSSEEPVVPHADTTRARLVGWKEISAYLRRSIRTVQRWECESNLPVRRYPTKRGEGVFAWPEELDAWLKSAPGALATTSNGKSNGNGNGDAIDAEGGDGQKDVCGGLTSDDDTPCDATAGNIAPDDSSQAAASLAQAQKARQHVLSPGFVAIGVLTFLVIATFLSVVFELFGRGRPPAPATASVVGEDIVAFDAAGKLLWKYSLDQPMHPTREPAREVLVDDLDGDGGREVVVLLDSDSVSFDSVLCLNANGTKRWSRRPDRHGRYGHGPMGPPWVPLFVKATGAARNRSLWVSWANSPFFGAFVERLDIKTGEPKAVYWSAGYIEALTVTELRGRPVLLLGACHHAPAGASLAVYDLADTAASAPAIDPKFTCLDCPAGRPLAFYVFPKTDLSRAATADNAPLMADGINIGDTGVIVNVRHAPGTMPEANAIYRFDRDLRLMDAETIDSYRTAHRELERQGKLTTPYSPAEERQLFPVLSWDGRRFVQITGPHE